MSLTGKRWVRSDPAPEAGERALAVAGELGILPAVARVLVSRGITDARQARAFLNPSADQLDSPWLMRGMEQAVTRIVRALERDENVVVHGDYDADGITATVILVETLRLLGGRVDYYLPSRFTEGYGLHRDALDRIKAGGASLVVTVDCGINAAPEVAYSVSLGLDIIITDHHRPLAAVPEGAAAVLNPLQEGCAYPFKDLSGAGIAFKLAAALREKSGAAFPEELLDLAALGTVADVVPLVGENRVLTALGLAEMRRMQRPGLAALARAGGVKPDRLHSGALAFVLAPSINASGRLGEAAPAARLLLERDADKARVLAEQLRRENQQRRDREQQILREAAAAVSEDPVAAGEKVITLAREGWHHGVVGIVASRLVERFHRPVVLIALENGTGRGSARSITGFDITAALSACASMLERFGGHEQAAGLTVDASRVEALRRELNRYAVSRLRESDLVPGLPLDGELAEDELTLELARQMSALQPFGAANPAPSFFSGGWELRSWRLVGANQSHLKLSLEKENRTISPIFFGGAALEPALSRNRVLDLAFTLKEGLLQGEPVLDIMLKDLRYNDSALCGRVEVIDRRFRGGRLDCLKELLGRLSGPAAVFAATLQRRAVIEKNLPPTPPVLFLTSGGENSPFPEREGPGELVLYDLPLYDGVLEPFFKSLSGEGPLRVHLLYTGGDRELNQVLADLSLPSAAVLEEIYRGLAESAAGGSVQFPGPARERLSINPGTGFWRRCLDVFVETGILHGCETTGFNLGSTPAPWPELLEGSPSFRAARELRERCRRFQELLLNGSPEDLARYWDERLLTGK